jgi:hypothetical protein
MSQALKELTAAVSRGVDEAVSQHKSPTREQIVAQVVTALLASGEPLGGFLIAQGRAHQVVETNLRDTNIDSQSWDVYTAQDAV